MALPQRAQTARRKTVSKKVKLEVIKEWDSSSQVWFYFLRKDGMALKAFLKEEEATLAFNRYKADMLEPKQTEIIHSEVLQ